MPDNFLDTPNFGVMDTLSVQSQELVDKFLDGAVDSPDDVKKLEEETDDTKKPTPKKVEKQPVKKVVKKEEEEEEEEEKVDPFDLDHIKDEDDDNTDDTSDDDENDDASKQKDKKATKKVETADDNDNDDSSNPFEAFSKELYRLNAFVTPDEGEPEIPKTPEEFLEVFNQQLSLKAEMALDSFLSRFGEDYQNAFKSIFVDGVNPRDYFQAYHEVEDIENIDLTKEGNQELVVRQSLKELGYEAEDIDAEVQKLKDYADLEEAAKRHHKVVVKKKAQKMQELAENQKLQTQQKLAAKKQFATEVNKLLTDKLKVKDFDGIPINPKLASEVQDMLVNEKWKNSQGEPLTDFDVEIINLRRPENNATKVKVALLLKLLKNDPTLSTIKKAGVTKQTNTLFADVVKNKPVVGAKGSKSSTWAGL